jgi:plastocyanin
MNRIGAVVATAVVATFTTGPATAGGPAAAVPAATPAAKVVELKDFQVRPATVRIRRGAAVEWRFLDRPAPHNVTSRGKRRFRSSPSQQTGTYRVRFRRSGAYRYVCTIHPNMRGRVVVGRSHAAVRAASGPGGAGTSRA